MRSYYVYILTNPSRTVLYIGMTNNLERRMWEHQHKLVEGFTKRYNCVCLIYYEETDTSLSAIEREKQLKGWKRERKEALIDTVNPLREDLSHSFKMTDRQA